MCCQYKKELGLLQLPHYLALSVGGQLLVPLSGIVCWWAIACPIIWHWLLAIACPIIWHCLLAIACPIIWHCLLVDDCLSHYLALSVGGRLLVPLSGIVCWWAIACPIIDCVCVCVCVGGGGVNRSNWGEGGKQK